jgi:hypothetical protein
VIDENYESPLEDLDEMIMNEPREKEYENDIEKQIPQYKKSIQSGLTLKLSMSSCTCNSRYLISKSSIRELCSKSLPSWFIRLTAVEMSSLDRVKWQIACSLSSQASVSSTTRMKCWLSYSSQPPLEKPRSPLPSPSSEP